jgi:hypothetical protein
MPTKMLFLITAFSLSLSATSFAKSPEDNKQSVESSLTGDNRWKNSNKQSAESILRGRQRPEGRQHMKRHFHKKKFSTQHSGNRHKGPNQYEQQRLKEKYRNNPPIEQK